MKNSGYLNPSPRPLFPWRPRRRGRKNRRRQPHRQKRLFRQWRAHRPWNLVRRKIPSRRSNLFRRRSLSRLGDLCLLRSPSHLRNLSRRRRRHRRKALGPRGRQGGSGAGSSWRLVAPMPSTCMKCAWRNLHAPSHREEVGLPGTALRSARQLQAPKRRPDDGKLLSGNDRRGASLQTCDVARG